jgi:hypothetical protein
MSLFSPEDSSYFPSGFVLSGSFKRLGAMTLTAKKILDRWPDLRFFANRDVTATNEGIELQRDGNSLSPSQQIFGEQFVEFDRSVVSLQALHCIVKGDSESYEQFIRSQQEPKLTWESFQSLHQLYRSVELAYTSKGWTADEVLRAAEVALVMGDFGKSETIRRLLGPHGITAKDHDDSYAELMRSDGALHRFSCFQQLSREAKGLLKRTSNLAHFGHITHFEGGSAMFRQLKKSGLLNSEPQAVAFAWLVHVCDVAGALGHKASQGAKVLNESTFRNMQPTLAACQLLATKSEAEAVSFLTQKRREMLGISVPGAAGDTIARIGAMSRKTTLEEGKELTSRFLMLKRSERSEARRLLSPPAADQFPKTPAYMPLMLVTQPLEIGLPILCEALGRYRRLLSRQEIGRDLRLNFNELAGVLKARGSDLKRTDITVDGHTGMIKVNQRRLRDQPSQTEDPPKERRNPRLPKLQSLQTGTRVLLVGADAKSIRVAIESSGTLRDAAIATAAVITAAIATDTAVSLRKRGRRR